MQPQEPKEGRGEPPSPPSPTRATKASGPSTDSLTTEAAEALDGHDYAKVLVLTEGTVSGQPGAWLDSDRASALTGLGRTDEAVAAFRKAQVGFTEAGDDKGRSTAIWGRARALDEAGRCPEAREAYYEFAAFVRLSDPGAAEMAAAHSGACKPVVVLH